MNCKREGSAAAVPLSSWCGPGAEGYKRLCTESRYRDQAGQMVTGEYALSNLLQLVVEVPYCQNNNNKRDTISFGTFRFISRGPFSFFRYP